MANQSPDYRTIYSNGVTFAMGDNDCRLGFGVSNIDNPLDVVEDVGVYMTHKALKILAVAASRLIAHYESSTGNEVAIDQDRITALEAALKEASPSTIAS